jgi:phosphoribosylformylglycinamidine synthase PurS subunit
LPGKAVRTESALLRAKNPPISQNCLARIFGFLQHPVFPVPTGLPFMKAKITITPKKAVLDPQGKAVQNALEHMGYAGVQDVHVGRYLEIEIDGEREAVEKQIDEACHKLLSNPVIEEYRFELE